MRVIPDHLADPAKWPFDPAYIGAAALVTWEMDPAKVANSPAIQIRKLALTQASPEPPKKQA